MKKISYYTLNELNLVEAIFQVNDIVGLVRHDPFKHRGINRKLHNKLPTKKNRCFIRNTVKTNEYLWNKCWVYNSAIAQEKNRFFYARFSYVTSLTLKQLSLKCLMKIILLPCRLIYMKRMNKRHKNRIFSIKVPDVYFKTDLLDPAFIWLLRFIRAWCLYASVFLHYFHYHMCLLGEWMLEEPKYNTTLVDPPFILYPAFQGENTLELYFLAIRVSNTWVGLFLFLFQKGRWFVWQMRLFEVVVRQRWFQHWVFIRQ